MPRTLWRVTMLELAKGCDRAGGAGADVTRPTPCSLRFACGCSRYTAAIPFHLATRLGFLAPPRFRHRRFRAAAPGHAARSASARAGARWAASCIPRRSRAIQHPRSTSTCLECSLLAGGSSAVRRQPPGICAAQSLRRRTRSARSSGGRLPPRPTTPAAPRPRSSKSTRRAVFAGGTSHDVTRGAPWCPDPFWRAAHWRWRCLHRQRRRQQPMPISRRFANRSGN